MTLPIPPSWLRSAWMSVMAMLLLPAGTGDASAQVADPLQIVCPPDQVAWSCDTNAVPVSFPDPQVSGGCAPSWGVACDPPSGSTFPLGTNQVICTVINTCGESDRCTFNVIVLSDPEPPVIECPSNIVAWACIRSGVEVNFSMPAVSDNADPDPTVQCTPPSGSVFPIGDTIVTCEATDDCGNVAMCSFTVTVHLDSHPPVVECPPDLHRWTCDTAGRTVTYPAADAADNSGLQPSVACIPPSGSFFPLGTTTVICMATDRCGNQTECSFTVTVELDTTPPLIQCSTNIVVASCNPNGTRVDFDLPTATDNYDVFPVKQCDPPSGSLFPVGVTTVVCEATDDCGNRGTCTFTVTVLPDATLPVLDANRNSLGDIWETVYQTGPLPAAGDADADGQNNADEEGAGTDALNPNSIFAVRAVQLDVAQQQIQLHWSGVRHKMYQVQAAPDPAGPWRDVNPALPGQEGAMSTRIALDDRNLPQPQPTNTFFRVRVTEVDMDMDGLTAWEEAIIGTSDQTPNTQGIPGGDPAAASEWLVQNGYGPGRIREVALAHVGGTPEGQLQTRLVTATGTGGWLKLSSWGVDNGTFQPVHLQDSPPFDGYLAQLHVLTPPAAPNLELNTFVSGRIRTGENVWFTVHTLAEDGTLSAHDSLGYGNTSSFFVRDYAMAHRALPPAGGFTDLYQLVTPVLGVGTGNQPEMRVLTWRVNADTGDLTATYDSGNIGLTNVPPNGGRVQIEHEEGQRFVISFSDASLALTSLFFDVNDSGTALFRGGGISGLPLRGGTNFFQVPADDFALAPLNPAGFMTALLDANCAPKLVVWEDRIFTCDPRAGCFSSPYYITDNTLDQSPTGSGVLLDPPVVTDSREENFDSDEKFGAALATGDFDGDGADDVAVGVPAQSNGGGVDVMYGSPNGLTGSVRDQHWTQNSNGIAEEGETGDTFGNALAAGDFNNDGFVDLAIGAPTEDWGGANGAGVVHVLYGTGTGLQAAGSQLWSQGNDGLPNSPEDTDWFGRSLTAGDFNGDTYADLAIGVYHQNVDGNEDAGAVHIIYGSNNGLNAAAGPGDQFLHQDLPWMVNSAEPNDSFGLPLVAGDINGDGYADLVAGIPNEDFGATPNVGAFQVIYGSASGLGPQNQFVRQGLIEPENYGFPGNPEVGDSLGWSLAVGDFDQDGFQDVAAGVPYEDLENVGMDNAGAVHIFFGTGDGLTAADHELWTDGLPEVGDKYGFALAAGDFDADGYDDLSIGTLDEDVNNNTVSNAGAVSVLYGSSAGLGYAHDNLFYQGAGGMGNAAEDSDKFGQVLAAGDLNGDGAQDVVVGIPNERLNDGAADEKYGAGAIHVIYGSVTNGLSADSDQFWWQGTQRRVHALLTDVQWEAFYGQGEGALFAQVPPGEPLTNHVASVTKVMTLLLAVEALDEPAWNFALDDPVTISALAGGTGGSHMENDSGEVLAANDVMALELLLYGMMLRSGNKASVAIAQYLTDEIDGFTIWSNRMNLKASELNMVNTLYTHPAGGCITTPQDQINLWLDGWQHPLFRQVSTDREYTGLYACGEDAEGAPKCFLDLVKLGDSGYPGLEGWKGGNGRLGPSLGRPNCTSSLLGQATRLGRTLALCLQQTGDRWGDNDRLLDYGYRCLFTPDNRGAEVLAGTLVTDFAVKRVTDTMSVTAVIDGENNLRLDTWQVVAGIGQVAPLANAVLPVNDLSKGTNFLRSTLVDVTALPTAGEAEADYLTGYLSNGELRLDIWRVGAEPGY